MSNFNVNLKEEENWKCSIFYLIFTISSYCYDINPTNRCKNGNSLYQCGYREISFYLQFLIPS